MLSHCAAISQIRHRHSPGHGYYERKLAEGTPREAIRSLKRRLSDIAWRHLVADARRPRRRLTAEPGRTLQQRLCRLRDRLSPEHRFLGAVAPRTLNHPTSIARRSDQWRTTTPGTHQIAS